MNDVLYEVWDGDDFLYFAREFEAFCMSEAGYKIKLAHGYEQ